MNKKQTESIPQSLDVKFTKYVLHTPMEQMPVMAMPLEPIKESAYYYETNVEDNNK